MKLFGRVISRDGFHIRFEREWEYRQRTFVGPPEPFSSMVLRTLRNTKIMDEMPKHNALLARLMQKDLRA